MAAKRRHWKEKNGRFWARISIPSALRPFSGNKTELIEALGGDLRIADRKHAAAVARLQAQLDQARQAQAEQSDKDHNDTSAQVSGNSGLFLPIRALTDADVENAVWDTYNSCLEEDAVKRAAMPSPQDIEDEREMVFQRIERGEVDGAQPTSVFNLYTDFELKAGARVHDSNLRARRLAALKNGLATGETRFVDSVVMQFVRTNGLDVAPGSREWQDLAEKMMRAQIQALERTIEFDQGVFGGTPSARLRSDQI